MKRWRRMNEWRRAASKGEEALWSSEEQIWWSRQAVLGGNLSRWARHRQPSTQQEPGGGEMAAGRDKVYHQRQRSARNGPRNPATPTSLFHNTRGGRGITSPPPPTAAAAAGGGAGGPVRCGRTAGSHRGTGQEGQSPLNCYTHTHSARSLSRCAGYTCWPATWMQRPSLTVPSCVMCLHWGSKCRFTPHWLGGVDGERVVIIFWFSRPPNPLVVPIATCVPNVSVTNCGNVFKHVSWNN